MHGLKYWTRIIRNWITPIFGLSLFIILISRISFEEFSTVITKIDIRYFIVGFAAGLCATVFRTIRYTFYFPSRGRWLSLYGAFSFMRLLHYVLPFNSGELVYLSLLKKYKFSPTIAETTPTWIILRVSDVIALVICFFAGFIFIPSDGILYNKLYSLRWVLSGLSAGLIIIILTLPFMLKKFSFRKSGNWFSQRLAAFKSGIERTYGLKLFIRTLIVSLLVWIAMITLSVSAQLTFNTPLELSECILASILVLCFTLLPINAPLNIGTSEAAWTGVMVMAGIDTNQAISIAVSIRIVSMLILFFDGFLGFYFLIIREKRLLSKNSEKSISKLHNYQTKDYLS